MARVKEFLTSRTFFVNLVLIVVFVAGVFGITYKYLDSYTHHGESISVPDLRGMKRDKLAAFVSDKHLRYSIVDSIFELDRPPEVILEQDPAPDSKVKEGRTIY